MKLLFLLLVFFKTTQAFYNQDSLKVVENIQKQIKEAEASIETTSKRFEDFYKKKEQNLAPSYDYSQPKNFATRPPILPKKTQNYVRIPQTKHRINLIQLTSNDVPFVPSQPIPLLPSLAQRSGAAIKYTVAEKLVAAENFVNQPQSFQIKTTRKPPKDNKKVKKHVEKLVATDNFVNKPQIVAKKPPNLFKTIQNQVKNLLTTTTTQKPIPSTTKKATNLFQNIQNQVKNLLPKRTTLKPKASPSKKAPNLLNNIKNLPPITTTKKPPRKVVKLTKRRRIPFRPVKNVPKVTPTARIDTEDELKVTVEIDSSHEDFNFDKDKKVYHYLESEENLISNHYFEKEENHKRFENEENPTINDHKEYFEYEDYYQPTSRFFESFYNNFGGGGHFGDFGAKFNKTSIFDSDFEETFGNVFDSTTKSPRSFDKPVSITSIVLNPIFRSTTTTLAPKSEQSKPDLIIVKPEPPKAPEFPNFSKKPPVEPPKPPEFPPIPLNKTKAKKKMPVKVKMRRRKKKIQKKELKKREKAIKRSLTFQYLILDWVNYLAYWTSFISILAFALAI